MTEFEVVFLLNDVFAEVTKHEVADTNGSIIFVNGVLTVVEKVGLEILKLGRFAILLFRRKFTYF